MNNNYSKSQLIILLAFYFLEKKRFTDKLLKEFTDKYNKIYRCDLSPQNIVYALTLFKNVDSSYNVIKITKNNEALVNLWNYFITNERIDELKEKYENFRNGININNEILVNDDEYGDELTNHIDKLQEDFNGDFPRPLYESNQVDFQHNKRDLVTAYNALKLAEFKCEYSDNHQSFIRKNIDQLYTEGHHLIPLKYQYKFQVNLDVEANIISLCSECHNILHYGRDYVIILIKLYNNRINRLNKCGIEISIEELINMYK